jgi:L-iditol 2-dehydrogenase
MYSDWETLEMVEVPRPEANPGEVVLRVEAAGICGSELEAVRKRSPRRQPPLILGHEFTGVIDSVGSGVQGWKEGDAVVANAVIADGTCSPCLRGQTHLCLHRQLFGMHRPGAFAEFVAVPEGVLVVRPKGLTAVEAALAEPLANGIHIGHLLAASAPNKVLVIGAGPIGLLAMQAIQVAFGAEVAVLDRSRPRLELASQLGATQVFVPEDEAAIQSWADSDGVPATVDAVGAESTKAASIQWLRPGGTAIWIGLHENGSPLNSYDLILTERQVQGSYACTQDELALALNYMASGKVDVSSWISLYPLEEADLAFKTMLKPGPHDVKGVIQML